jgi:Helix-turn-helix.
MYEIFELLLKSNNITRYKVSVDTGIPQATISHWKSGRNQLKVDKLQILADYFDVSLNYMLGIDDEQENITNSIKKDIEERKNIDSELADILDIIDKEDGLMFHGEPLDNKTIEALKISLKNTIELAKAMNKKEKKSDN